MFLDTFTRNKSFILYAKLHPESEYILALKNSSLSRVNPYSENLTDANKRDILIECSHNIWYYLREIYRDKDGNRLQMNDYIAIMVSSHDIGVNTIVSVPGFGTQRDDVVKAIAQQEKIQKPSAKRIIVGETKAKCEEYSFSKLEYLNEFMKSSVLYRQDTYIYQFANSYDDPLNYLRGQLYDTGYVDSVPSFLNQDVFMDMVGQIKMLCLSHDEDSVKHRITIIERMHMAGILDKLVRDAKASDNTTRSKYLNLKTIVKEKANLLVDMDIYDLQLNPIELVKKLIADEEFLKLQSPEQIRLFSAHILHKKYDELDILQKHTVHELYIGLLERAKSDNQEK